MNVGIDERGGKAANAPRAPEARLFNVFDFQEEGEKQDATEGATTANVSMSPVNVFDFQEEEEDPRRINKKGSQGSLKKSHSEPQVNRFRSSVFPRQTSAPLINIPQGSQNQSQGTKARKWSRLRLIPFISRASREKHNDPEKETPTLSTGGLENITTRPNSLRSEKPGFKEVTESIKRPQASRFRWSEASKKDPDVPPIFTWQIDSSTTNDAQSPSSKSPTSTRRPTRNLGNDSDNPQTPIASRHETLREILVDADVQAGYLLRDNSEVSSYFDAVSDRSRMHIDAARAQIEERMQLPQTWDKQKHVVADAMRLMDAFVPPHEHERSELEGAFCGAMVEILEGEVSAQIQFNWHEC